MALKGVAASGKESLCIIIDLLSQSASTHAARCFLRKVITVTRGDAKNMHKIFTRFRTLRRTSLARHSRLCGLSYNLCMDHLITGNWVEFQILNSQAMEITES